MDADDQSADGLSGGDGLAAAEARCRRILTADPSIAEALALLGVVAHQRGRSAEGLRLIASATTLNGTNPGYHSQASAILLEIGRPAEAEASARTAAEMAPDFALAHYNRGIALDRLGRHAEAEASFRRALALQPDDPDALNNLGLVLNTVGRWPEAEAVLRRSLSLRPNWPERSTTSASPWARSAGHKRRQPPFARPCVCRRTLPTRTQTSAARCCWRGVSRRAGGSMSGG